jgi:hypothetical protein
MQNGDTKPIDIIPHPFNLRVDHISFSHVYSSYLKLYVIVCLEIPRDSAPGYKRNDQSTGVLLSFSACSGERIVIPHTARGGR